MKVIESINIKNCFTHVDTFIEFSEGLNYIVSEEGKGKSLVLECIAFSFFGNSALRDVVSSYKKLEVILIFNYNGFKFKIERKTSDAILSVFKDDSWVKLVVGTSSVNSKIVSLFGYDYTIYLLSNYCQQNELQSFSKLTPAKKLSFIDKISGIEDAKELLSFLETRKKDLKKEITFIKSLNVPVPTIDLKLLDYNFEEEINELEKQKVLINEGAIQLFSVEKELELTQDKFKFIQNCLNTLKFKSLDSFESLEELLKYIDDFNILDKSLVQIKKELLGIENKYSSSLDLFSEFSKKDLQEHIENLRYNERVTEKQKFLKSPTTTCPSCSFSFSLSHKELSDYSDVSDFLKPIQFKFKADIAKEYLDFIETDKKTYLSLNETYEELSEKHKTYPPEIRVNSDTLVNNYKEYLDLKDQLLALEDSVKVLQSNYESLKDKFENNLEQNTEISFKISELIKSQKDVEIYIKNKELSDRTILELNLKNQELKDISTLISVIKEYSSKIKNESIPLINYHASKLLNSMTESVLSKLEITDNYDILVNNKNINLCSGSEKDTASLAFRLSLGYSIIPGMLPLFIGDEIDAASRMERSLLITKVLQNLSNSGYQVILITHKDVSNFENCNIIDLNEVM